MINVPLTLVIHQYIRIHAYNNALNYLCTLRQYALVFSRSAQPNIITLLQYIGKLSFYNIKRIEWA